MSDGKQDVMNALRRVIRVHGTQVAAAKRLGFSNAFISDVINGRRDPSVRLAAALGFDRVVVFVERRRQ